MFLMSQMHLTNFKATLSARFGSWCDLVGTGIAH